MSIFHDNAIVGSSGQQGYKIERSLRFNSADSAYLSRAGWTGNRRLQTFSFWVKRTAFGSRQTLFGCTNSMGFYGLYFEFDANDALLIGDYSTGWAWQLNTTARYRDPSAWYHIVFAVDTANATASNRARLYVNGIEVTVFSTASYMSQNYDTYWSYVSYTVAIGRLGEYNGQYFNGYMTDVHFIDGQALTPSSFGETNPATGVWQPKRYTGTYGTNGFYLKFADNSGTTSTTLGKDSSGNGNNWTPNNFSVTAGSGNDSMIDTPTPYADGGNGRGNYCTWNPLSLGTDGTLSDGNLQIAYGGATTRNATMATMGMTSGKWYWEITPTASSLAATACTIGITNVSSSSAVSNYPGFSANGWGYEGNTGSIYNNGSGTSYGATFAVNDVIGVAFDATNGKIWFSKNGTFQASGDPAAGTNAAFSSLAANTYYPAIGDGSAANTFTAVANFGQRPFAYTPPSGFLALNTQNLPEPSIKKPSSYMDVAIQTGNTTGRTVSGLAFQPDLVWVKNRAGSANRRWGLIDSVRGVNKTLASDRTDAEVTSQTDLLTAFNSGGFTIGADAGLYGWNGFAESYAHFVWKKSATPGFDIVSFASGTAGDKTFSHALGVAPSFMIVKSRDESTYNWGIYHSTVCTNQQFLRFTSDARVSPGYNVWGTAIPTSSVFGVSVSDTQGIVKTNQNCIAYLWSEVAGFSKFGSYTGNGSSDGPFVFCGFRPKVILAKATNQSATNWVIQDTTRFDYNQVGGALLPQRSDGEFSSSYEIDILSNGFKLRRAGGDTNASGTVYMFAAWAESPAKYSLAR